ncbi:MAG: CRISPR-associated endonuclease Cas3'' [Proteobacteria bacterium]|nr:CRISPR-associated endonuclease Cas3'' [Pseudomonadota bacterium]
MTLPTGQSRFGADSHYAHSNDHAVGNARFHLLADHLREVGRLSAEFAAAFDASDWGRLAGLWHDLGKYRDGFQRYIRQSRDPDAHIEGRVVGREKTHSTAGALHALGKRNDVFGRVLAFLIAGHHTGLQDLEPSDGGDASLKARLADEDKTAEYMEAITETIPADIRDGVVPTTRVPGDRDGYALWIRMLFSCLVDADFLDTEAYFDPEKAAQRGRYPSLAAMQSALDAHLLGIADRVGVQSASVVNDLRAEVLATCRAKAALPPGFFTLTVPTGGGKTLSSLAFALEHAITHGKRHIVYAIPYTSIIEQNAGVFREVFAPLGEDVVVEHHSNLDVDERKEDHANRLASENWDAPLIVTTNVQLFESLHAARTSQCRKLHNLVGSVIVLDEAQMLPRDFLAPVLRTLKLLVAHYGVTVVLCTATQPMLASRYEPVTGRKTFDGIEDAHEIIDAPEGLSDALQRVDIHLPTDFSSHASWDKIAEAVRAQDCALTIVNTRKDARELFGLLRDDDAIHLSALMCAQHRSAAIAGIRDRLEARRNGANRPLRVVSTQLVEAGADLDFPVVYRALAGMDSIAQAAGRCNREGRLKGMGQVHVFVPPTSPPPGELRQAEQTTRELAKTGLLARPLSPITFRRYFDLHYGNGDLDAQRILDLLKPDRAAFRTAAEKFRLIDDAGETVIVPYNPNGGPNSASPIHEWVGALKKDGNAKWARRKLQRYTVNVPRWQFEQLLARYDIEERAGLWVAVNGRYDAVFGLMPPEQQSNPADLFVSGGTHAQ